MCLSVCLSLCPHKRFVYDSDHNFCPIFLSFGSWVRHVIAKTKFDGQVPRINAPFHNPKPFGGKLSLSQWTAFEHISRRQIKVSSQNLPRILNKLNFTHIAKFGGKGCNVGHVTYLYILGLPQFLWNGWSSNFKFGVLQLEHIEYILCKRYKIRSKGSVTTFKIFP